MLNRRWFSLCCACIGMFLIAGSGDDSDTTILETTGGEPAEDTGAEVTGAEVTGADVTGADVTGADVTGADVTGADETGEPAEVCDLSPPPISLGPPSREDAELLVLEDVCDYPALVADNDEDRLDPDTENFNVYVYRPSTPFGGWPAGGPWPAIFFVPGASGFIVDPNDERDGTETDLYAELLPQLAAAGFVVFAGQPPGINPRVGKRMSMLACMMLWAKDSTNGWSQADEGRIGQAAVIAGHSRGGGSVSLLVDNFAAFQELMPGMEDYELCSAVGIAPKWSDAENDTLSALVQADAAAPPYLVVHGAIDEDVKGEGISAYDAMVPEDDVDLDITDRAQPRSCRSRASSDTRSVPKATPARPAPSISAR